MVGVRDTMQGVVRHGRNMILPVRLGVHDATVDNTKVITISLDFPSDNMQHELQRGSLVMLIYYI